MFRAGELVLQLRHLALGRVQRLAQFIAEAHIEAPLTFGRRSSSPRMRASRSAGATPSFSSNGRVTPSVCSRSASKKCSFVISCSESCDARSCAACSASCIFWVNFSTRIRQG